MEVRSARHHNPRANVAPTCGLHLHFPDVHGFLQEMPGCSANGSVADVDVRHRVEAFNLVEDFAHVPPLYLAVAHTLTLSSVDVVIGCNRERCHVRRLPHVVFDTLAYNLGVTAKRDARQRAHRQVHRGANDDTCHVFGCAGLDVVRKRPLTLGILTRLRC